MAPHDRRPVTDLGNLFPLESLRSNSVQSLQHHRGDRVYVCVQKLGELIKMLLDVIMVVNALQHQHQVSVASSA